MGVDMTFFEKVCNCEDCPCLNVDRDESVCNLGCRLDFRYMENEELIYSSTSCELISINLGNKILKPVLVYATKIRPDAW